MQTDMQTDMLALLAWLDVVIVYIVVYSSFELSPLVMARTF
jgi:hypothetical protein